MYSSLQQTFKGIYYQNIHIFIYIYIIVTPYILTLLQGWDQYDSILIHYNTFMI